MVEVHHTKRAYCCADDCAWVMLLSKACLGRTKLWVYKGGTVRVPTRVHGIPDEGVKL